LARREGSPCGRALLLGAGLAVLWASCCRTSIPVPSKPEAAGQEIAEQDRAPRPRERLQEARRLLDNGRIEEAKLALQGLTADGSAPWRGELLLLQARIARAESENERAALYLEQLLDKTEESATLRFSAHLLRADLAYGAKDWQEAYRNYLEAANSAPSAAELPPRIALRLCEIALYQFRDAERARMHLASGLSGELSAEESNLLGRLKRRLRWQAIGTQAIGLSDSNISALRIDGDDLWIGTWNGGVSRYSLASGQRTVFQEGRESLVPNTVRCIEATSARVWVGTYQGLFLYSKASSSWQEISAFGGSEPKRVEAVKTIGSRLFVGTLGDGLWTQTAEGWARLSGGGLPGDFVSCLEQAQGRLLIGTLNRGLVLMDLEGERFRSFDSLSPQLEARNITMLLEQGDSTLWIGTYGMGLYRWSWAEGRLEHFTRQSGDLGDDWVLCGLAARSGVYFGTLGGGITRYLPSAGRWQVIGLKQGLADRDISAMAYEAPFIFLGTLGGAVTVYSETEALE
jgi:hypothetical protein